MDPVGAHIGDKVTLPEIRRGIPDALFRASAPRSLAYVLWDAAVIAVLFKAIVSCEAAPWLWWTVFPLYVFAQVRRAGVPPRGAGGLGVVGARHLGQRGSFAIASPPGLAHICM